MNASEECVTALRIKIRMSLYFVGTDERAKNKCGDVDHQTKKII